MAPPSDKGPRAPRAPRSSAGAPSSAAAASEGGAPSTRPDIKRSAKRRAPPDESFEMARLFIGVGRQAGVRPSDLVGAIAGEAGVEGKRIGAIQIGDTYSLVEVPEPLADQIIAAMRQATLRGRKAQVRRDRG